MSNTEHFGVGAQQLWPNLPDTIPRSRRRGPTPKAKRTGSMEAVARLRETPDVLFLDIETTGLSCHYDELTLVGYQTGGRHHVYISGDDADHLHTTLQSAACLVTFNGTLFDIPFLRRTFPGINVPSLHVDLRYAARRVGLVGGQKAIEVELGLAVRDGLDGVDGRSAVLLWHRYLRGDTEALRTLIRYNFADVRGMRGILDVVLDRSGKLDLLHEAPLYYARETIPSGHSAPTATLPSPTRLHRPSRTFEEVFAGQRAAHDTIVGIDLTGSESRPTGFCVLRGREATTTMIRSDDEIITAVLAAAPRLVSIDSPLSLPKGRISVFDDDPGRAEFGIMRICERILKRRGINVYPCLLPSMQRLTARGIALAARLRAVGVPVIESYPGAAQDIMGIPRKGAGEHLLKAGLADFGIRGTFITEAVKHDELDAITSALVGTFFLAGKSEGLGAPGEGALVIPDLTATASDNLVIGISGAIAAGKTSAARFLETMGFAYARFSQAVDAVIEADGRVPDRALRQQYGWRLHVERGQGWLLDQVLQIAGASRLKVIDGLRFPEDHANLVERFGGSYLHLHVSAGAAARAARLGFEPEDDAWTAMQNANTEARVHEMGALAHALLTNNSDLAYFLSEVAAALPVRKTEGQRCPSRS